MAGTITLQPAGTPIDVDFLSGSLFSDAQRQEVWQQAGINGYGAQILGIGDSQFEFRLVKFTTTAALRNTWKQSLYALKAGLITVVDDHGVSFPNLLVVDFSKPIEWTILKDGSATKSMRCELVMSGVEAVVA